MFYFWHYSNSLAFPDVPSQIRPIIYDLLCYVRRIIILQNLAMRFVLDFIMFNQGLVVKLVYYTKYVFSYKTFKMVFKPLLTNSTLISLRLHPTKIFFIRIKKEDESSSLPSRLTQKYTPRSSSSHDNNFETCYFICNTFFSWRVNLIYFPLLQSFFLTTFISLAQRKKRIKRTFSSFFSFSLSSSPSTHTRSHFTEKIDCWNCL